MNTKDVTSEYEEIRKTIAILTTKLNIWGTVEQIDDFSANIDVAEKLSAQLEILKNYVDDTILI